MQLEDSYLQDLLARLDGLTLPSRPQAEEKAQPSKGNAPSGQLPHPHQPKSEVVLASDGPFLPLAPTSLEEARISDATVESLMLKYLLQQVTDTGRSTAEALGLPFKLIEPSLARLRTEQLIVYRNSTPLGDFYYQLTERGINAAQQLLRHGTYVGTAPVHLDDYSAAVAAQTVTGHRLTMQHINTIFEELGFDAELLNQVGQALVGGKGFFLYGAPGNGKTMIAERVAQVFGQYVWIPRTLGVDGQIIRLYDAYNHVAAPPDENLEKIVDKRWVRIRRPAIITGGELTMDRLELLPNLTTGVSEAPLQMKSNCGTLVIDDFGRQRCSVAELLNRWIVPLDRGYDFLHLTGGKTIQVPFDQLLVFSTNLQPSELVDEAFLRRIPYKLEISDPTEQEFRELLRKSAKKLNMSYDENTVQYMLEKHYYQVGRPLRRCHARDVLTQVRNYCCFNEVPLEMTPAYIDLAVNNYFVVMEGSGST